MNFSIGNKYKDEVWCDIVPMDAYYLFLDKPWQFDRNVIHNGFKNIYYFEKDDVKVILGPCKIENISKLKSGEDNFFISK
jgi:hypothetical protein